MKKPKDEAPTLEGRLQRLEEILGQLDLVALASELRAEPQRAEQLLQWTRKVQRADGAGFRQQELFPAPS